MDKEKAMSDMIKKMNGYDEVKVVEKDNQTVPKEIHNKIKRIIEDNLDYFVTDDVPSADDIVWFNQLIDLYEKAKKVFDEDKFNTQEWIQKRDRNIPTLYEPYIVPLKTGVSPPYPCSVYNEGLNKQ